MNYPMIHSKTSTSMARTNPKRVIIHRRWPSPQDRRRWKANARMREFFREQIVNISGVLADRFGHDSELPLFQSRGFRGPDIVHQP